MRFNAAVATALYSFAVLLGQVRAEDVEDESSSPTTVEDATTTSVIEKPTFTVSSYSRVSCLNYHLHTLLLMHLTAIQDQSTIL